MKEYDGGMNMSLKNDEEYSDFSNVETQEEFWLLRNSQKARLVRRKVKQKPLKIKAHHGKTVNNTLVALHMKTARYTRTSQDNSRGAHPRIMKRKRYKRTRHGIK